MGKRPAFEGGRSPERRENPEHAEATMSNTKARKDERGPREARIIEAPDSERQLLIAVLGYKTIPAEARALDRFVELGYLKERTRNGGGDAAEGEGGEREGMRPIIRGWTPLQRSSSSSTASGSSSYSNRPCNVSGLRRS